MTQSEELNIDDQNSNELFCKFNSKPVWQRERAPRSLSKAHVSHLPLHMSSATFSQDIPGV